jgi:cell division protein ZipA
MDKTQLQLILIGAGAVIIALIYFLGKYAERKERTRDQRQRVAERSPEQEPIMNFDPSAAEIDTAERQLYDAKDVPSGPQTVSPPSVDVEIMPIRSASVPASSKDEQGRGSDLQQRDKKEESEKPTLTHESGAASLEEPKMTVILMIMAGPGKMFQGSSILLAIQEQKLKLREGVFECFPESQGQGQGKSLFGVGHLLEPGTFDLETINNLNTPGLIIFMQLPGPLEPVQATHRLVTVAKTLADKLGGRVCDERGNKITAQGFSKMESDAAEFQRQLRLRSR